MQNISLSSFTVFGGRKQALMIYTIIKVIVFTFFVNQNAILKDGIFYIGKIWLNVLKNMLLMRAILLS